MSATATAPAPAAKVVPKFGGGGVKCKGCNDNVYASERIDYDGQTYHTTCFKCLSCKSVVSLAKVAMITGDLYCKNCFMRIFTKEGKYSSFGEKTLPKDEIARRATVDGSAPGPSSSPDSAAADASPDAASASSSSDRRSSVILSCVVAGCSKPRVAKKSYCIEHVNAPAGGSGAGEASEAQQALSEAIDRKNVDKVREILGAEKNADILFHANNKGVTPLEQAFTGIQNSRACGEAMVQWLGAHVKELEKKQ